MFRAAHRSSSGALNCICSLWFRYTCGDRPLSSLSGKIYYPNVYWRLNMFRAAHRSSPGVLNCICSLWFRYTCGDRPLSSLSGKIFPLRLDKFIIRMFIEGSTCFERHTTRSSKLYLQPLV